METDERGLNILHLVGSPTSRFYFELSLLYARPVVRPEGFRARFLAAYPDGSWSILDDPDQSGPQLTLPGLLGGLPKTDLVVPHLFCPDGLTVYRSFFERMMGLPLVGSPGEVLRIAQRKHLTRLVAAAAGVRVAEGRLVEGAASGDLPEGVADLTFPVVVKPDESDNSDGLSLVRHPGELEAALRAAAVYGPRVLVEDYVPGRELRGAVIELNGELLVLPFIEYLVSERHPVRLAADKLRTDGQGGVTGQSAKKNIPAVCPAAVDDALAAELGEMMRRMHRALGCRDFSLFDFRVHERTGVAYLLEAGLFWSFGELSMVSTMLAAAGLGLEDVTGRLWRRAALRG